MDDDRGSITWEEPWRTTCALRIPREAWRPLGRMAWVLLLRPFLLALGPCAAILWWASDRLPPVDLSRVVRLAIKLPAVLVFVAFSAGFAVSLMMRSLYTICPPLVEVSRTGIRLGTTHFPHAKIRSVALLETRGRRWMTYTSAWLSGKVEVPQEVDLAKLRSLLDTRDKRATEMPDAGPGWPSVGRLYLGMIVLVAELAVVMAVYFFVLKLVLGGDMENRPDQPC
jgi:hypothetical protein